MSDKYKITSLETNSNLVKNGDCFFAIRGQNFDGRNFINHALENGAKLIVTDDKILASQNSKIFIYKKNINDFLLKEIKRLYSNRPAHLIGVTGTNGKSSVVSYCYQLLSKLGEKSACIGTLGVNINTDISIELPPISLTTFDLLNFSKILDHLAKSCVNYAAFEASSHGLAQERLKDIKIKAAAFTSFSHDHLDYHKNIENYYLAKKRLFTENLIEGGIAILNSRVLNAFALKKELYLRAINTILLFEENKNNLIGYNPAEDAKFIITKQNLEGQNIIFDYKHEKFSFNTEIIGNFQINNIIIAALLVHHLGFDLKKIVTLLPKLKSVKGRLERVTDKNNKYQIFIDYAHTAESLELSLKELKKFITKNGRLLLVFGCGGDRDKEKRPIMGLLASKIADLVIVTDDNPRYEEPAFIRGEIIKSIEERKHVMEIADRQEAIEYAIKKLKDNDILLIAGKGHEDYQLIKGKKYPFDDGKISKHFVKINGGKINCEI